MITAHFEQSLGGLFLYHPLDCQTTRYWALMSLWAEAEVAGTAEID